MVTNAELDYKFKVYSLVYEETSKNMYWLCERVSSI